MLCMRCPLVVASVQLEFRDDSKPILGLLCLDHVREFVVARRRRDAMAGWSYCGCGNRRYLGGPGPCERCRLGLGPPDVAVEVAERGPITGAVAPQRPRPTGLCGHPGCLATGALYPGGRWCARHRPAAEAWMSRGRETVRRGGPVRLVPPALMAPRPCPVDELPSALPAVLKRAAAAGWRTSCTLAISAGWLPSVVTRFSRADVAMVTAHENGRFKYGWWGGPGGAVPLGWRQVSEVLSGDGSPPAESTKDIDRAEALIASVFGIVA